MGKLDLNFGTDEKYLSIFYEKMHSANGNDPGVQYADANRLRTGLYDTV